MSTPTTDRRQPALLTPQAADLRLLEEATQENFRTGGLEGLWPVNVGNRKMFRPQGVESFIRANLQGAA
jgi:hypothetical protein